jgi:hypothetical protein
MQTLTLSPTQPPRIQSARDQAIAKARESLREPVVLSWRDLRAGRIAPEIPGAVTPDRWKEYGIANGGALEIDVGEDYRFILGDSADFEGPEMRLSNLHDAEGHDWLCLGDPCTEGLRRPLADGSDCCG